MKRFAGLLAALLVAGCAGIGGQSLVPGKSGAKEVAAVMGAPALTLKHPDGGTIQYFARYRAGPAVFAVHIGVDGVLRDIDQRLVYRNIHRVRAGMRAEEVRELLGPPFGVTRLPRQQRDVWEYPWRHAVRELRVLFVQFSDDGIVREVIERHDYERDPENDWG